MAPHTPRSIWCLLLLSGAVCSFAGASSIVTSKTIAGVFMVSRDSYSFTATMASNVCTTLQASIASKAQVEEALRNGLETCKFGWVEERIAVVPRITASPKCGQNKTGVAIWRAREDKLFDVFCYKTEDTPPTTGDVTAHIPTSHSQERSTSSQLPATVPPSLIKPGAPVITTSGTVPHPSPSTHRLPPSTVHRRNSTSSSLVPLPTSRTTTTTTTTTTSVYPPSSSPPLRVHFTASSATSPPTTTSLSPQDHAGGPAPSHSNPDGHSNIGATPTALLITLVIILALLALSAVYYKKKGRTFPFQKPTQDNGTVETEMFKHFRETDLRRNHSVGGDEKCRKSSCDTTLLMEQGAKTAVA